jgi:hypothetical protein
MVEGRRVVGPPQKMKEATRATRLEGHYKFSLQPLLPTMRTDDPFRASLTCLW